MIKYKSCFRDSEFLKRREELKEMEAARQALQEQKANERQYRLDIKVTGGGDQPPQPPPLVPDEMPASLPLYG